MKQELNLFEIPLRGTNLIEANAGTGKTYNITGLFTRMIVENGYNVESILVVTFTNAAVSDLKAKIYRRLTDLRDAMQAVQSGAEPSDTFEYQYAQNRSKTLTKDLQAVKYAIRDFDQCAIFTIHGFCQRMLKESAFSGKIPYDIELTGDLKQIIKKPVEDFWRKNVYRANKAVIPHLATLSPVKLIDFYAQVSGSLSVELIRPERDISSEEIENNAAYLQAAFGVIAKEWELVRQEIAELLDPANPDFPLKKSSYKETTVPKTFSLFEKHIDENIFTVPNDDRDLIRLVQSNITKNCKKGCSLEHSFFEIFENWYKDALEFNKLAEDFLSSLQYRLCEYMEEELEKHKIKNNMQSYDDLITRMRDAVCTDNSLMADTLYNKYHAALIDEFQDTDPYQYDIFHNAFGRRGKPFFMIGDPKQAIYSFRGADVYAYLKAAKSGGDQYTLTTNYRSDSGLVDDVNKFFDKEGSFLLKDISYTPSTGDKKHRLVIDGKEQPPATVWDAEKTTPEMIAFSTARHIAELLNKSASGNAEIGGKKIQPSDIAVLCRSRKQMMMVKDALSMCRVPAVMSGSESVFGTAEARELISILTAVISPFSQRSVKTAMATSVMGYTASEIAEITETEEWDSIVEEFRGYNDIINLKGFAPMFFNLTSKRDLFTQLAGMKNGERKLTNLIHLTELAQKFELDKKAAPADILKWMIEKVSDNETREDEAELKMDSDENAVTIITIFKSKGLEYNIVYTPFLMFPPGSKPGRKEYPRYHSDDSFYLDITDSQDSKNMAADEKKAEDLRIAYVALTRAKSVCYTAWGDGYRSAGSSMSRLIKGDYGKYDPSDLTSFSASTGINIKKLPDTAVQTYRDSLVKPESANRNFTGTIPEGWRINSFSRLIHSSSAGAKDTDQYTAKPQEERRENILDIFSFPKGAKAGTCLHEIMESVQFDSYSKFSVMDSVHERLEKYSFDADFTPAVTDNIISIIEKDMNGVRLSELENGQYIHEMEFQLSTGEFSSDKVAEIFENNGEEDYAKAASILSFEAMAGFMNGFADLIFEQNGKYYILDWKSNHLGADTSSYSYDNMHTEMLGSHYYMQMYIYTLALHMHLKGMIPDYSYDKYIGGGIYVFMRGVNSGGDEGIYTHRPKAETIEQLEKLVRKP